MKEPDLWFGLQSAALIWASASFQGIKTQFQRQWERALQNISHTDDLHSKAVEACIYLPWDGTMEAVSNWKEAYKKCNVQIIWRQSSLICEREREKTLLRSPNPDKHTQCFRLFVVLSALVSNYECSLQCQGEISFLHKRSWTGSSGKELEVKISFYRVNSEIWSVRVIQWLVEWPCLLLPCPFYLNVPALQPSTTLCHLSQQPSSLEMWISALFFLTTEYQMISPWAIHLDP